MDLGGQILHYFLKSFSLATIIISILFFFRIHHNNIDLETDIVIINKGESFENIIDKNIKNKFFFDNYFFKIYYFYFKTKKNGIHYGNFIFEKKITFSEFLNIISKPSNLLKKLTIIEGSSKYDLNKKLSENFIKYKEIDYLDILADTYKFDIHNSFESFLFNAKLYKNKLMQKYKNSILFNKFSEKEILIIASLIEKEGLDYIDKKKIFSVIMNRLDKKMKLQIDATVIYSLTDGQYNLNRKLNLDDLKYAHPFNTYHIKALPPMPISYVGTKTIELMAENYKTNFYYYFFDKFQKKHIFSETYEQHKYKLDEYRKKF